MGFGVDVGIDAERYARSFPRGRGNVIDAIEFLLGFYVETEDIGGQSRFDFVGLFTDTRKNDTSGVTTRLQYALKFAAGDDVETGTQPRQQSKQLLLRF